jgi:hypothetical protein
MPGYESRNPNDLEPEFRRRILATLAEYNRRFPDGPWPALVATYRDGVRQDYYQSIGASQVGAGWSMHNWRLAADVGWFERIVLGQPLGYLKKLPTLQNRRLVGIAKFYGLECGADWTDFPDPAHFQAPQRIEAARAGLPVRWPPFPQ